MCRFSWYSLGYIVGFNEVYVRSQQIIDCVVFISSFIKMDVTMYAYLILSIVSISTVTLQNRTIYFFYTECFKGAWSRFWSNFIFLFLLFTMLYECISNDQMKFRCPSMSFKQDTGLTILRHVDKARALFLFTQVQYTSNKSFSRWFVYILILFKHK